MKLFVDTPVVMAAVSSNGLCDILLEELMLRSIPEPPFPGWQLRTSTRVVDEVCQLLGNRLGVDPDRVRKRLERLSLYSQLAPAALRPINWQEFDGLDEADGWLLADALRADSRFFITADRQILRHYAIDGMRIVAPREALDMVMRGVPIARLADEQERASYLARRLESVV